jgi:hypothetical protein
MRTRRERWERMFDEDPATGLLNLFDVWIAFAVALLLATVSYFSAKSPEGRASLESVPSSSTKLEHYRPTADKLSGTGERLGVAYRLDSGDVVYVPDTASKPSPGTEKLEGPAPAPVQHNGRGTH